MVRPARSRRPDRKSAMQKYHTRRRILIRDQVRECGEGYFGRVFFAVVRIGLLHPKDSALHRR